MVSESFPIHCLCELFWWALGLASMDIFPGIGRFSFWIIWNGVFRAPRWDESRGSPDFRTRRHQERLSLRMKYFFSCLFNNNKNHFLYHFHSFVSHIISSTTITCLARDDGDFPRILLDLTGNRHFTFILRTVSILISNVHRDPFIVQGLAVIIPTN